MTQDVVDYILQEIKAEIPSITDEQLEAIEEKTRQQWGGDDAYVAKKKIKHAQKQKAVSEYIGGKPLKLIRQETGVGRATLYRHLKK